MSEPINDTKPDQPIRNDPAVPPSPGALLRAAREAQGLHIGALAVALKVPVKKLEALETDRFDLLPDTVFARALALSVCRTLKIDASPIMLGLPQLQTPQMKNDESGLNTSFREASVSSHNSIASHLTSPMGAGVLLLLLTIAAILFWPARPTIEPLAGSSDKAKFESSDSPAVADKLPQVDSQPSSAIQQPANLESLPEHTAATNANRVPQGVLPAVALSGSSTQADAGSDTAVLELTARGASWVDVTDAKGRSQLRKTTVNGEVLRISGDLPLTVVVGRADLVAVSVRGQPMDLIPVSKDNVARFEVK